MASAFLIEHLNADGSVRNSLILSRRYPCPDIDPDEQRLAAVESGGSYSVAERLLLLNLKTESPEKAARLQRAMDSAREQARRAGKPEPVMVEAGMFGISTEADNS